MFAQIRPAIVLTLILTVVTGLLYPLAITGLGQTLFAAQANSSQVKRGDVVVGSSLIGQNFTKDIYFWPRPSATSPDAYNAGSSSGSNLGPTSQVLVDRVKASVDALKAGGAAGPVPADAVTTSASGLDPDISPDYAKLQIDRVAKARALPADAISALVTANTRHPVLGIFGEAGVNVLALNMALDDLKK
ncbi:potassium-transporting ATPase subunit KdpC [Phyllobacterium myrsinacearum]|uniref:Potassium-transporting ATPase KdpC subunit n=1 Tax=Phyllobacterium myrsinacearum TaxID=28101 RepID=A0A839EG45_9HYPH|nr:potassium-transporting ATPase subunit KdpC [Phyllobacterium myrsinacearum]MBA8877739.1 K+-transporting ATPase ATPase C chain [Phyllobacterium myrsinacearum]